MKNISRIILIVTVLALLAVPMNAPNTSAQSEDPESCSQIVQLALNNVDNLCEFLDDNQACYGHAMVNALPQTGITSLNFQEEGDIEELIKMRAIRLSPMDMVRGVWGVAMLKLRAYIQYANPEVVTFLLFGDTDIENNVDRVETIDVTAIAYSNVRLRPSVNTGVVGVLEPGTTTVANGRTEDSMWVRVTLPENLRPGWTYVPNLADNDAIDDLAVVDSKAPIFGPMQAFTLRSGIDDSACPESPQSGMLIQTPEGLAEVTLLINEVSIQLQATAFVQADPGGEMSVGILSGQGWVEAGGVRQPVFAGTQVSIPIGEDLAFADVPAPPQPYDMTTLNGLPLNLLDNPVEPSAPMNAEDLANLLGEWEDYIQDHSPGSSSANDPASDGTVSDEEPPGLPPGLNGVPPPGQGGTPPGQGGTPPGQAK